MLMRYRGELVDMEELEVISKEEGHITAREIAYRTGLKLVTVCDYLRGIPFILHPENKQRWYEAKLFSWYDFGDDEKKEEECDCC